MTYSILGLDEAGGAVGGACVSATPSVGGFVLHAAPRAGVVATQGTATSVLYGEQALRRILQGETPQEVVAAITQSDTGRAARQVALMDPQGHAAAFTGEENEDACCTIVEPGLCVVANRVVAADLAQLVAQAYRAATGTLADRLLAALAEGARAGGDRNGDRSAALRIVSLAAPPIDLRVDDDPDPVARLAALWSAWQEPDFVRFRESIPTHDDPYRRG